MPAHVPPKGCLLALSWQVGCLRPPLCVHRTPASGPCTAPPSYGRTLSMHFASASALMAGFIASQRPRSTSMHRCTSARCAPVCVCGRWWTQVEGDGSGRLIRAPHATLEERLQHLGQCSFLQSTH